MIIPSILLLFTWKNSFSAFSRFFAIYIRQETLKTVPLALPMKTVCTLGPGDELKWGSFEKLGGQLREPHSASGHCFPRLLRSSVASTISSIYPRLVACLYTLYRRHHNHPRRQRGCDDCYPTIIGNDTCRLPLVAATFNQPRREKEKKRKSWRIKKFTEKKNEDHVRYCIVAFPLFLRRVSPKRTAATTGAEP